MARLFKPIQLFISSLGETEGAQRLKDLYAQLEAQRELEVSAQRKATVAAAEATIVNTQAVAIGADTIKLENAFLSEAAKHFRPVAVEPQWVPFRNDKDDIVIESVFTRRDQRNAMRVQKAQMETGVSGKDLTKTFEEEDSETVEEASHNLGFKR